MDNVYLDTYVLPYQELLGNYNDMSECVTSQSGFTIPRTARELQLNNTAQSEKDLFYHTKNC